MNISYPILVLNCIKFNMKLYVCTVISFLNLVVAQFDANQNYFDLPCTSDDECSPLGNCECTNNTCICQNKEAFSKFLKISIGQIGEACMELSECIVDSSYCNGTSCECIEGNVASSDKRKCLSVSEVGWNCEEDVQCYEKRARCLNNKCGCPPKMHDYNETCYKSAELGSTCATNEECAHISLAFCKNNLCSCPEDYVKSFANLKCLSYAVKLFSECEENIQCKKTLGSGALCLNGSCNCLETHQYKSEFNKCVSDVFVGGDCGRHSDCHQPGHGMSRMMCIEGKCKCRLFYVELDGFCVLSYSEGSTYSKVASILPYFITYIICYMII